MIAFIDKEKGDDSKVDEIFSVNPSITFGKHCLNAKIAGGDSSMLTARALAIIRTPYEKRTCFLMYHGSCVITLVKLGKSKFANLWDIAAKWQNLGSRRQNFIRGN